MSTTERTAVYSESTTERLPGRAWTVRLQGYSDRSATVTCTTEACRMPLRSKDLASLRAFAAQHAAAHARAATVRPNAWCHCGSQRCGAHPDTRTYCAGAVVMILRHDSTVRRVWSVEEVCETCAPLIPNATVLARAARPASSNQRPAATAAQVQAPARPDSVAGGFSSPSAAPAENTVAPAWRSRRTSHPRRRPGQAR
ncbi:hypothetical protein ACH419_36765 [Streptomyces bobili]|uniref:hypothetical protein n=1 Tax=Streptomyces bobili TaxID=67280 RepID=UPI00379DA931